MKFTKKRPNNAKSQAKKDKTWEKFKNQQNKLSADKRGIRR
ncbi:hypothetical protein [Apilactobacillus micheneri]|nr:hypothetical protein [Apilactobacillus micheneri]